MEELDLLIDIKNLLEMIIYIHLFKFAFDVVLRNIRKGRFK